MNGFARVTLSVILLSALLTSCQSSESERPATKPGTQTSAKKKTPTKPPAWVAASKTWADTLRYTLNSDFEVYQDDLLLRMRPEVFQDFRHTDHPNSTPLDCQVLVTVRPIPTWPHAKGMVMDSVVFYDTVRKRRLPPLPMLSTERQYDEQTVRTLFTPNLANPVQPELTDGQLVEPIIYMSWDGRTIIARTDAIPVTFLTRENMEREMEPLPKDPDATGYGSGY